MKKKIFAMITLVLTMFALVTVSGCKQLLDEVNDAVIKANLVRVWELTDPNAPSYQFYSYFDGNKMYVAYKYGEFFKAVTAKYTVDNGKIILSKVEITSPDTSIIPALEKYLYDGAVYDCTVTTTTLELSNGTRTIKCKASTGHSPSDISSVF